MKGERGEEERRREIRVRIGLFRGCEGEEGTGKEQMKGREE